MAHVRTFVAALLLASVSGAVGSVADSLLWPVPQSVQCVDGNTPLAASFAVDIPANSPPELAAAAKRYQALYTAGAKGSAGLAQLNITVQSTSNDLSADTVVKCVACRLRMHDALRA
jgi:hypothetical protein